MINGCTPTPCAWPESEEAFEGLIKFSIHETSNDFSRNGKHIVSNPEQEAAIRVLSIDRMSLQSIYQILVGDYMVIAGIRMSLCRFSLRVH